LSSQKIYVIFKEFQTSRYPHILIFKFIYKSIFEDHILETNICRPYSCIIFAKCNVNALKIIFHKNAEKFESNNENLSQIPRNFFEGR